MYQLKRRCGKMAYMLVRHKVKDFDAWKSVFDSVADLRRKKGEQSYRILRDGNGSNELFALFTWDTIDNARKYASSPELRAAMERAGVVGKPDIYFLEEAARGDL
jgi:antibiotic biosynthesis monooxygenase (ABM) superfamily enzyme